MEGVERSGAKQTKLSRRAPRRLIGNLEDGRLRGAVTTDSKIICSTVNNFRGNMRGDSYDSEIFS